MGPFSNNTPPPVAPNNGSKLPVPDVEGPLQTVIVSPDPDPDGVRRWLNITLILVCVMAIAGIAVFAVSNYLNNTPNAMLNAAFQNLITSDSVAGTITYQANRNAEMGTVRGDFLAYSDPTAPHVGTLTVNVGQDASRISATLLLFADSNYFQVAGLGNLGRLIGSACSNAPKLTADSLVRLGALDDQWYSITHTDIQLTNDIFPQHTMQSGPVSTDVETIERLYLKYPFLTAAQQLSDEQINNVASMHLKASLNATTFDQFLQALKSAQLNSLHLTDADLQMIAKNPTLSGTSLEIWISRSDRTFQQIRLTNSDQALTLTYTPGQAAAHVQTVNRPATTQDGADFIRGFHDALTSAR